MQNTVIGVYDNYSQAQAAVNELTARGFQRSSVNLTPEEETYEARTGALGKRDEDEGWSLGKFFRSLFGTDEEAGTSHTDVYHEAVRRGSYLVTVEADSDEQRDQACEVLNRFDPVDIDERSSQWRSDGWSSYDRQAGAYTDADIQRERSALTSTTPSTGQDLRGGTLEGEARLPVVEEELRVGKRTVQRGGVRIVSKVTERPVEESVRLRDEKVNVQRRPVNKPATQADLAAFKEGSMELRETAEEPVVSKTARVVEEVVVNKDVRERDEKVKDTVRRSDVDVQQMGGRTMAAAPGGTVSGTGLGEDDFRSHWQGSYAGEGGRYEDYEPAYRFGSELRTNQTYRGRSWNDIEPEARRDWEARHAGSPWERAKDAVRHAWERATT